MRHRASVLNCCLEGMTRPRMDHPSARAHIFGILTCGALLSCMPREPPHWAEGGARLTLGTATWQRDDEVVEIRASGDVYVDGDHLWTLDRVGRVVDEDNEAVAILFPDGTLVGTDDSILGHVGLRNAAPPFHGSAWLSLTEDGSVVRFDDEGDRSQDGKWRGCTGPVLRSCTLVTQLVALRNYARQPTTSVGVGIGIGF